MRVMAPCLLPEMCSQSCATLRSILMLIKSAARPEVFICELGMWYVSNHTTGAQMISLACILQPICLSKFGITLQLHYVSTYEVQTIVLGSGISSFFCCGLK